MTNFSTIQNDTGKVIAVVINNTRYSPEILMLQLTAVNMQSHNETVKLWKEAAEACYAEAAELREQVEKYAARIADADKTNSMLINELAEARKQTQAAESAMAVCIDDMFKRGDRAEYIGLIIRAARDVVNLNTEVSRRVLAERLRSFDAYRATEGVKTAAVSTSDDN